MFLRRDRCDPVGRDRGREIARAIRRVGNAEYRAFPSELPEHAPVHAFVYVLCVRILRIHEDAVADRVWRQDHPGMREYLVDDPALGGIVDLATQVWPGCGLDAV